MKLPRKSEKRADTRLTGPTSADSTSADSTSADSTSADSMSTDVTRSEDGELLRCFQGGDTKAFTALVRRWEEPAYRIACRVTRCHAAAEDVRQTVFLRLLEKPRSIRSPARFAVWLRRAIVNESINVARRARRLHDRRAAAPGDGFGRDGAVFEALGRAEEIERLERALDQLAPKERALLSLRFDEELTFQEISDVIDKPISTIKTQARRAVARLGRIMAASDSTTHKSDPR